MKAVTTGCVLGLLAACAMPRTPSPEESGPGPGNDGARTAGRSAGDVIDDGLITSNVKKALVEEPTISALHIVVETRSGVVQLSGVAGSEEEKKKAAEVASGVPGVKQVRNDIRIRSN